MPMVAAQIQAADIVLINKSDLAYESQLELLEAKIRTINPRAALHRTVLSKFAAADVDLLEARPDSGLRLQRINSV